MRGDDPEISDFLSLATSLPRTRGELRPDCWTWFIKGT